MSIPFIHKLYASTCIVVVVYIVLIWISFFAILDQGNHFHQTFRIITWWTSIAQILIKDSLEKISSIFSTWITRIPLLTNLILNQSDWFLMLRSDRMYEGQYNVIFIEISRQSLSCHVCPVIYELYFSPVVSLLYTQYSFPFIDPFLSIFTLTLSLVLSPLSHTPTHTSTHPHPFLFPSHSQVYSCINPCEFYASCILRTQRWLIRYLHSTQTFPMFWLTEFIV